MAETLVGLAAAAAAGVAAGAIFPPRKRASTSGFGNIALVDGPGAIVFTIPITLPVGSRVNLSALLRINNSQATSRSVSINWELVPGGMSIGDYGATYYVPGGSATGSPFEINSDYVTTTPTTTFLLSVYGGVAPGDLSIGAAVATVVQVG